VNGRQRFAAELARHVPPGGVPVLIARRGECGCRIAAVYRVAGRLILAGQRRSLVETGGRRHVELVPFLVPDLDAPVAPEDFGCRHSAGHVLDMGGIAEAARHATRRRTPFVV